ncbi:MAG: VWA domain-containing protein [Candidatus Hydrogenedentes bacterium]|nr:VWA domain-containing protein [Candidatus Hydrogenedentota bacterium]
MRQRLSLCLTLIGSLVFMFLLLGCPPTTRFEVYPEAVYFEAKASEKSVVITSPTGRKVSWSAVEVRWNVEESKWVEEDIRWLSFEPSSGETSTSQLVKLRVSRAGLSAGEYKDVGVKFSSGNYNKVLPVSMSVEIMFLVEPRVVYVKPMITESKLTLTNKSNVDLSWKVKYIPDLTKPGEVMESLPSDVMVIPSSGLISANGTYDVTVKWDETRVSDFGLLFVSTLGEQIVEFRYLSLCAENEIEAIPKELVLTVPTSAVESDNFTGTLPTSKLILKNKSSSTRKWSGSVVSVSGMNVDEISATPTSGTINGMSQVEVSLAVSKPKQVQFGAGVYYFVVDFEGCFVVVPLRVEQRDLPVIAVSQPPQPSTLTPVIVPIDVLDFGREEVQKEFWIANIGPLESRLYFRITHEDEGSEKPIIAEIKPNLGGANGEDGNPEDFYHPSYPNVLIDGVRILVTINRDNLVNDVEYRTIKVEALDRDPIQFPDQAVVLSGVEPKTIKIRVEKQPLVVEGAFNRSRPPYVMRFVFLLRDSLGNAVPTQTPQDLSKIGITITEDDVPIDLRETNYYISGAEDIKGNIVIMLDYTGSMYYAGVNDPVNPRRPGEALEDIKKAVIDLIYDIPESYQIALMFHNDRQQTNRLIRSFTTDKELLRQSLESFYVPPNLMGATDIYDALSEAIDRLVAEDAKHPLPFDDADVKGVIFITDGWDNASSIDASDIQSKAHDNLVRLFPIGYSSGGTVSAGDLITLAKETGGHYYSAKDVESLLKLFGNRKSLVLRNARYEGGNLVSVVIHNEGRDNLSWRCDLSNLPGWIRSVTPNQSTIPPGDSISVQLLLAPENAVPNIIHSTEIPITSNDGSAEIKLQVVSTGSEWESVSVNAEDETGRIWNDLRNQLVLTYITTKQQDFKYSIRFDYKPGEGLPILAGVFEDDAFAYIGDIRAGQISLLTSGLFYGNDPDDSTRRSWQAVVYVRADYIPRDVYILRTRYFLQKPDEVSDEQWRVLMSNVNMKVEPAEDGLLTESGNWRFVDEGDNIYLILTSEENAFPYGSFGNLFKITLNNLDDYVNSFGNAEPVLYLGMRVDNELLVSSPSQGGVSRTKYFLYPGGPTYPEGILPVTTSSKLVGPSTTISGLAGLPASFNIYGAWDIDKDGISDFMDPYPNDNTRPGGWVRPLTISVPSGVSKAVFYVENNILDTFSWNISSFPDWVSEIRYGEDEELVSGDFSLSPGEKEKVTLYLDTTGLAPGSIVVGEVEIESDLLGTQKVRISVQVGP